MPEDKPWLVDLIDKEQMKKDMEALSKVSDIQLVSMHWGDEYQTYPNDEQQDLANYLNELGAEVVIGSHPHVIQPAKIIKGKNKIHLYIIRWEIIRVHKMWMKEWLGEWLALL